MSKRIKELKKEIEMEEKDFNIKESSFENFINHFELLAKLEERKLSEKEEKKKVDRLKEKMWKHNKVFEGVKCKTCLPLDYVENLIDEIWEVKK